MILLLGLLLGGCEKIHYQSVAPENEGMRYLLFPVRADGAPFRAILISGKELYSHAPIGYYKDGKLLEIDQNQLTLCPDYSMESKVSALNHEIREWGGDTDFRRVEFGMDKGFARLTIVFTSGRKMSYNYRIVDNLTVDRASYGGRQYRKTGGL
jgi:hypothetical protein